MYPTYTYEATYRPPNEPPTEPPTFPALAAFVVAPFALLWALTHPTAALVAVALVATVAWHCRVGGTEGWR